MKAILQVIGDIIGLVLMIAFCIAIVYGVYLLSS